MTFATPVESATISELEITVTLELKKYEEVLKCYHGKSTRPMTMVMARKQKYPNNNWILIHLKNEMEKEATNAALMAFFRDHFEFIEFKDLYFDELRRPLKEIKLRSKMMK